MVNGIPELVSGTNFKEQRQQQILLFKTAVYVINQ